MGTRFRIWVPYSILGITLAACLSGEAAAQNEKDDLDCEPVVLDDGSVADCVSAESSIVSTIAHARRIDTTCPPPTEKDRAGNCVLSGDVVLDAPLMLDSFVKLNCKGHSLLPERVGRPDDSRTGRNEYIPSSPEVAIVLAGSRGVTVQNCRIGSSSPLRPFDFGLLVIGSKVPTDLLDDPGARKLLRSKFLGNSVVARYVGVTIGRSDDVMLADNDIVSMVGARGIGINVINDSDSNDIKNNSVTSHSIDLNTLVPLFPGGGPRSAERIRGIRLAQELIGVVSFCTAGQVIQVATEEDVVDPGSPLLNEGNLVEGNFVKLSAEGNSFGITTAAGNSRPLMLGNLIAGAGEALHMSGIEPGESIGFAGSCSLDPERKCANDSDCFIAGCDSESKGVCEGAQVRTDVYLGTNDALVQDNLIDGTSGRVDRGINVAKPSERPSVIRNTVRGATVAGIRVIDESLEDATVMLNRVEASRFGLSLSTTPGAPEEVAARFYGARISLNDILGSTVQAVTGGACRGQTIIACATDADCPAGRACEQRIPFNVDLSFGGQGNYWGRTCDDSNGFRDADEPDASGRTDSNALHITDSHPFGGCVTTDEPAPLCQ